MTAWIGIPEEVEKLTIIATETKPMIVPTNDAGQMI